MQFDDIIRVHAPSFENQGDEMSFDDMILSLPQTVLILNIFETTRMNFLVPLLIALRVNSITECTLAACTPTSTCILMWSSP